MIFRLLTPFLSIVIVMILFTFFIQPQYDEILKLRNISDQYNKFLDEQKVFAASLDEKLGRKNAISLNEQVRFDKLIPQKTDATNLVLVLDTLAKNQNMLFGNIALDEQNSSQNNLSTKQNEGSSLGGEEQYTTTDVTFDVIGTYVQFKAFIASVEASLPFFEIVKIDFSGGDTEFIQFTITVRSYGLASGS